MADSTGHSDMAAVRRLLGRHLVGSGVELGPGHQPFPIAFPGVRVTYLDRWRPEENRRLFTELKPDAAFPVPDHIYNLDTDRLRPLADASQNFVVASHVLEHVAEPIGLIDEIHRVLKPGGVALILLPDRRRTFDRRRAPTTLDHLVAEFEAGVREVDDQHILEFLEGVGDPDFERFQRGTADERRGILDRQRLRSVHAHCWAEDEFLPVLLYTIRRLGHRWEFVDGVRVDDEGQEGIEFGYVLRRCDVELPGDVRCERFETTWKAWADTRHRPKVRNRLGDLRRSFRRWIGQLVRRSPWTYRAARRIRNVGQRRSRLPDGKSASAGRPQTSL